jgi:hypothetical protein
MAITFNNQLDQFNARRNVAQQNLPKLRVAQQVVKNAEPSWLEELDAMKAEIVAIKHDVAELRLLMAKLAGTATAAQKSRAEYYREYRKRKTTS